MAWAGKPLRYQVAEEFRAARYPRIPVPDRDEEHEREVTELLKRIAKSLESCEADETCSRRRIVRLVSNKDRVAK